MESVNPHPTLAVAAPTTGPLHVPAWWDFDGKDAPRKARDAAFAFTGLTGHPCLAVQHHPHGVHVLSPTLLLWDDYLSRARRYGADAKAAEIAVERGQPFLRVSPRPYDQPPIVTLYTFQSKGYPRHVKLDRAQVAAVGTYLSTLSDQTLAATYRQDRPEGTR